MYDHAPDGYDCPFCRNIRDGVGELPLEVIHRTDEVFVKMNPRWRPNNPGSVLVAPIEHHENIYDLPDRLGSPLQAAVRVAALAMKAAYGCDGVSTRQHNEPAGDQDVWHLHIHVFPRFAGDDLDASSAELADQSQVRAMAARLRAAWPVTAPD